MLGPSGNAAVADVASTAVATTGVAIADAVIADRNHDDDDDGSQVNQSERMEASVEKNARTFVMSFDAKL